MNSKIRAFLLFFIISLSGNIYGDCCCGSIKLRTFLKILECVFCSCCKKTRRVRVLTHEVSQNPVVSQDLGVLKKISECDDLSKLPGAKISLEESLEEKNFIKKREEIEKKEDQAKDLEERRRRVREEILAKLPGYRGNNEVEGGLGANGLEEIQEELKVRSGSGTEWIYELDIINFELKNGTQECEPKSRQNSGIEFTSCLGGCSGGSSSCLENN